MTNEHDHLDFVMADIRNIFGDLKADMRIGFDQINDRLDQLNGRTRQNETEIAILRDRSDHSFTIAGTIGAAGGAIVQAAVLAWSKFHP